MRFGTRRNMFFLDMGSPKPNIIGGDWQAAQGFLPFSPLKLLASLQLISEAHRLQGRFQIENLYKKLTNMNLQSPTDLSECSVPGFRFQFSLRNRVLHGVWLQAFGICRLCKLVRYWLFLCCVWFEVSLIFRATHGAYGSSFIPPKHQQTVVASLFLQGGWDLAIWLLSKAEI